MSHRQRIINVAYGPLQEPQSPPVIVPEVEHSPPQLEMQPPNERHILPHLSTFVHPVQDRSFFPHVAVRSRTSQHNQSAPLGARVSLQEGVYSPSQGTKSVEPKLSLNLTGSSIAQRKILKTEPFPRSESSSSSLANNSSATPLDEMNNAASNQCLKVFVQRDYSEGTLVKFQTRFPTELEGKIERQAFETTVAQLNAIYEEAEKAGCNTYCEGCMACLTAYLMYICTETHYEKCLRKVAKFVMEQNERVYNPRGLLLTDPTERGLRVIEIAILNEPAATRT